MTRFAPYFLLWCLSCLLTRSATAQAISPLKPIVVQLVPGDVVRERLVGVDSATYQAGRQARLLVPAADALQADLRRENTLVRQQLATTEAALLGCLRGQAASEADYHAMQQAASASRVSPARPPALVDSHTYAGAGAGALLVVLLKLFVLH